MPSMLSFYFGLNLILNHKPPQLETGYFLPVLIYALRVNSYCAIANFYGELYPAKMGCKYTAVARVTPGEILSKSKPDFILPKPIIQVKYLSTKQHQKVKNDKII